MKQLLEQFTRERLETIKEFGPARIITPIYDKEIELLAQIALAVMDAKPNYPEKLPCPVLLEPGMRFGKGVPTATMLGAMQRRAEYYAELDAMTPEKRQKHEAAVKGFREMLHNQRYQQE